MAFYNEADLIYTDYQKTALPNDNPKITGPPDSTLFNRMEKYEVLYLINKLAELWDLKRKSSGNKIETMIRVHLPGNIKSQEDVRKWIHDNWDNY